MKQHFYIAKEYLKFHYIPHIVGALLLCTLSPFFMGVKNLDAVATARVLEQFFSLVGIILFIPIFIPDQDLEIRNLLRSKKESLLVVKIDRLCVEIVVLILMSGIYLLFLKANNCIFPIGKYWYLTIATALFLGALGIFIYAVLDNPALGYAIPMLYYMSCFGGGGKYFGKFYLFSFTTGHPHNKIYLMIAGLCLLVAALFVRRK